MWFTARQLLWLGLAFSMSGPAHGHSRGKKYRSPKAFVATPLFLKDVLRDGVSNMIGLDLKIRGRNRMTHYKFKFGEFNQTDCSNISGYSASTPKSERLVQDISGTPDGEVILCLLGQRFKNGQLKAEQGLNNATKYHWVKDTVNVDDVEPIAVVKNRRFRKDIKDGSSSQTLWDLRIKVVRRGTHYKHKIGLAADTDCSDDAGYSSATPKSIPLWFDIAGLPDAQINLCLLGLRIRNGVTLYEQIDATVYTWLKDTGQVIPAPGAFAILTPTGSTSSQTPIVTWEASQDASAYDLTITSDASCATVVQSFLDLTTTSQVVSPLTDGDYYSCVTAKNAGATTTAATNDGLMFSIDATPPGAFDITGPLGEISDQTPTITWDASAGADTYDLIVSTASDCSIATIQADDLTSTDFDITAPLSDGTYYICVTANDVVGNSTDATNNGNTASGASFIVDTAPAFTHIMFATSALTGVTSSTTVPPAFPFFGGIDAADWICTFSAFNAGLVTSWDGVSLIYRALLSEPGNALTDRLLVDGPVFNTNSEQLATDKTDLLDGSLDAAVGFDEFGSAIVTDPGAWTGSNSLGQTFGSADCGSWVSGSIADSGRVGDATTAGSAWLSQVSQTCDQTARLYCISPPIAE